MSVLFAAALLAFSTTAEAGKGPAECRGYKLKEDAFTGALEMSRDIFPLRSLSAIDDKGLGLYYLMPTLRVAGGAPSATLTTMELGAISTVVPAGVTIFVKHEDGTVQEWTTTADTASAPNTDERGRVVTTFPFSVSLSNEQVAQLASSPVVAMRVPRSNGEFLDWTPAKILQRSMVTTATCMQALLSAQE